MNIHYYQGPYENHTASEPAYDVVVPETVIEEPAPPVSEEAPPPPYSQKPFISENQWYNPETKQFLNRFHLDDVILLAIILLLASDSECDPVLLIVLGFLLLSGFFGEGACCESS